MSALAPEADHAEIDPGRLSNDKTSLKKRAHGA
ncbi:hypothetical protein SAMN05216337_1010112 [Bradyrhizobium brasilense]|uniref:Uncharacterized protein n=1 Tax=Bradyrhizobium brasilense TaxID=1419277 RepID=A0A1G6U3V2_9BRAD|nr:hypothetical protein SAMN05216337_1010112 [Bradyrhizobium brasilense]